MLGCQEAIGEISCEPTWHRHVESVHMLLCHRGESLYEKLFDGWMVPFPPVEEKVFARCLRYEVVRAAHGGGPYVLGDQPRVNVVVIQNRHCSVDVSILPRVRATEEP